MADSSQYLRLVIDGTDYLLPSAASLAIEQRDTLAPGNGGPIAGYRQSRIGRWAAYTVTASFQPGKSSKWQRAVFIDGRPQPVGIAVDEVQLLGRVDMHVAPFAPLGPPPTRHGHFFNAAWVDGYRVTFVIDPRSLAGYLASLGA